MGVLCIVVMCIINCAEICKGGGEGWHNEQHQMGSLKESLVRGLLVQC